MAQDRKRLRRLYADAFVAARVSVDLSLTEGLVGRGIIVPQRVSGAEAIDERG